MLRSDRTKWANVMVIKHMDCNFMVFLFTQAIQIMVEAKHSAHDTKF